MTDRVPETWQVKQDISSFVAKILAYAFDDFSNWIMPGYIEKQGKERHKNV